MALDSYIYAHDEGINEIGYWCKCWYIHSYMAEYYQQHYDENEWDFNCIPMQLNQEMLEVLLKELSEEHLLDSLLGYSNIHDYGIEELQKVISYSKSNPDTPLYFYSWY